MILRSFFLAGIALLATAWVSGQTPAARVAVGDAAPDFTLTAQDGRKVTLSNAVADGPVALVFYRGWWCPFCARQLAELRTLSAADAARVYAISVDPKDKTTGLVKKIEADGKAKVAFSLLADPNAATIDAYGLRDPRYKGKDVDGIPYPTVIVVGAGRKILWLRLEEDYRNRPATSEIAAALESARRAAAPAM